MGDIEVHRIALSCDAATVIAQFAAYRHLDRAGFYAVMIGPCTEGYPVVIATEDLQPGPRWEFRTSGLWAEQVQEQPTASEEHWSYGLEAFAIRIDDPAELLGRGFGDRCALGWELDVFTPHEAESSSRWQGRATGLLLYENLELEIDGPAERTHWRFETDGQAQNHRGPLLQTTVGDAADAAPTVMMPTALGEWAITIADRPASG